MWTYLCLCPLLHYELPSGRDVPYVCFPQYNMEIIIWWMNRFPSFCGSSGSKKLRMERIPKAQVLSFPLERLSGDQSYQLVSWGARILFQAGGSHFFLRKSHLLAHYWRFPREAAHLCKVLLRDPPSPFNAQVQGAAGVGHVRTLDHHAFDQGLVLREVLPRRAALAVAAVNLESRRGLVQSRGGARRSQLARY